MPNYSIAMQLRIIISGTMQGQRCDARINTVGYGKKGGLNCDGDSV